jgi:hypothetical protein
MNDELANDRTFLAWLRSGITLFGLGFVVAKAALVLESGSSDQDLYATAECSSSSAEQRSLSSDTRSIERSRTCSHGMMTGHDHGGR